MVDQTLRYQAELCTILGLNPGLVQSIAIRVQAGEIPMVEVQMVLFEPQLRGLAQLMQRYHLVEV